MNVTEAKVTPMLGGKNEGLAAFAEIRLDGVLFMRKLRLIHGTRGMFVSLPQEELRDRCSNPKCRNWNVLRAQFCNWCGLKLEEKRGLIRCRNCKAFNRDGTQSCTSCQQRLDDTPKFYRDIVMLDDDSLEAKINEEVIRVYRSILEGGLK